MSNIIKINIQNIVEFIIINNCKYSQQIQERVVPKGLISGNELKYMECYSEELLNQFSVHTDGFIF